MKPGKKDIPIKRKISGRQLEELQKHNGYSARIRYYSYSGDYQYLSGYFFLISWKLF